MSTFQELGVIPEIQRAVTELGFEQPMPVQSEVIPRLLAHTRDIIALAQTGTGKTAAFGIPVIQKINVKQLTPHLLEDDNGPDMFLQPLFSPTIEPMHPWDAREQSWFEFGDDPDPIDGDYLYRLNYVTCREKEGCKYVLEK